MFKYNGYYSKRIYDDAVHTFQRQLYSMYFTMEEGVTFCMPPPLLHLMVICSEPNKIIPDIVEPVKYCHVFNAEYDKKDVCTMIEKKFPIEWTLVHPANVFHVISSMADSKHKWTMDKAAFEKLESALLHRLCAGDIILTKETRESVTRFLKELCKKRIAGDVFTLKQQWEKYSNLLPFLDILRKSCLIFLPLQFTSASSPFSMLVGYQDFKNVHSWLASFKDKVASDTTTFHPFLCEFGIATCATLFWVNEQPPTTIICFKVLHPQAFLENDLFLPMFPSNRNVLYHTVDGKDTAQMTPMISFVTHNVNDIHVFREDESLDANVAKEDLFNIVYHTSDDGPSHLFYMTMSGVPSNSNRKRNREQDGMNLDDVPKCAICCDLFSTKIDAVLFAECGHSFCKSCIDRLESIDDNFKQCPICRKPTFVQRLFFS